MRRARTLALLLLTGLLGCPPTQQIPAPADLPTADAVAAALAERRTRITAVSGRASVQRRGPEGRERAVVTLLLQRPAALRFQATGPLNQSLGVLVADGAEFGLYAAQEGRYYHGPASPENLGRLFGLALEPASLVDVLLGGAPIGGAPGTVDWDGERGLVRYVVPGASGGRLTVWLDHPRLAVHGLAVTDPAGATRYELATSHFEEALGVPLPRRLEFTRHDTGEEVTIKVRRLKVNPQIAAEPFRYEPPAGVPRERVE